MESGSTYEPPTDEQLARFACVRVHGPGYTQSMVDLTLNMFKLTPSIKTTWLGAHRSLQEQVVQAAYRSATEAEVTNQTQTDSGNPQP